MQRRKFIAGLGSLAAAGAAGIGTGAFTTVQANRSVNVNVASDSNALLAFQTSNADNSEYVSTSNSAVSIDVDDTFSNGTGSSGSGVNANATTQINDLFKVVNQGTQAAVVYVDPDSISDSNYTNGDWSGIAIDPQASNRPNGEYTNTGAIIQGVENDQISLTGNGNGPTYSAYVNDNEQGTADALEEFVLEPGESFDFGLYVKTDDTVDSTSDIDATIELIADATRVPDSYTGDNTTGQPE
ncbi:uncharacterized protein HHUB_3542 [Halobacterium hubeiense]|uniref:DUF1102 domain-containing protein n=1 Tax=Halobacterium hubeiense TaxID=1407499 RepID=A0A0U5H7F9_9EURY|nr:hypothetical protein [Halobacterium hubeiense]CQH61772.1 uncharacterized protein HHUB_3542 [Halobacterium hubeiense]